jgi:hypothetical protein
VEKVLSQLSRWIVWLSQNSKLSDTIQSIVAETVNNFPLSDFKLLLLRNFQFTSDSQAVTDQLLLLLKLVKSQYLLHQEQDRDFHKLMVRIYPKYKPRSEQQTTQRDRSVTNPMFTEYDQLLYKNKVQFRKYAQISVSLIDLFVKLNLQADNLVLFEKQKFFETVMSAVQAYVDLEQSHI